MRHILLPSLPPAVLYLLVLSISVPFDVGNTATYAGSGRYDWEVFLLAAQSELQRIEYVVYALHSSYSPSRVRVDNPADGFALKRQGSREFDVQVTVVYKSDNPAERSWNFFEYHLNLFNNPGPARVHWLLGPAKIMRKSKTTYSYSPLSRMDILHGGDVVSTGENGRADLLFSDGSLIRLEGATAIQVSESERKLHGKSILCTLLRGRLSIRQFKSGKAVATDKGEIIRAHG